MKYLAAAITFAAFYALIGGICYYLHSAWPLLGLLCTPEWKFNVRVESETEQTTTAKL